MPGCEVLYYREGDSVPVLDWLRAIPTKAQNKCLAYLAQLELQGHELRRPEADFLRDGVYELRVRHLRVNYRMLYFFSGQRAVLAHGFTKEGAVPGIEIDRAIERRRRFERSPDKHTYRE